MRTSPCFYLSCSWRNALWLNTMHCGKKWWIREFVAPYIFPLNPDYVAARSLRSLRSNHSTYSRTFRQHKCTDWCGKKRTLFIVGRWRHHTKGVFTLASSFSNRRNLIFFSRKLKTPLKTSSGNMLLSNTSNKLCPSYIILPGLPWKFALDQKPSNSSSAATTSLIYFY